MKNYLTKIESFVLIAFLFLLPWQTRLIISAGQLKNEYWEYGTISLYGIDILLLITIGFFLFKRLKINTNNIFLPVLILGLAIVNIFSSLNPIISITHWLLMLLAIAIFYVITKNSLDIKKLTLAFIVGAALAGLLGTWQFSSQTSFSSKWLGLALHNSSELGPSVIEATAPDGIVERWLRAYGPFDHPNVLGGYMALALIVILYFSLHTQTKTKLENYILIISTVLVSAGLICSFSRSAWLAAFVGIIILLFQAKATIKKLIPFLVISAIVAGLFLVPYYYLFTPRFETNTRLEQISSNERFNGWKDSLAIIKSDPLVGVGLGTYGLALEKQQPDKSVWFYQPVHNTFLLILAELGIVGLLLLIFITKRLPLALLGSLIVIALFDHWLLSLHIGPLALAVVAALTVRLARDKLIS